MYFWVSTDFPPHNEPRCAWFEQSFLLRIEIVPHIEYGGTTYHNMRQMRRAVVTKGYTIKDFMS